MELTEREKEVQSVVNWVASLEVLEYYNPHGADWIECPACRVDLKVGNVNARPFLMKEIPHKRDCMWLIAKDLSTNLTT